MMTPEQYVDSLGLACPYCDSTKIRTVDDIQADGGCAWQYCVCNTCAKRWAATYNLVGFWGEEAKDA